MKTRIISAIIALPFLFYIMIAGGLVLQVAALSIAIIGQLELIRAIASKRRFDLLLLIIFSGMVFYRPFQLLFVASFLYPFVLLLVTLWDKDFKYEDVAKRLFAFEYVLLPFVLIYLLRLETGPKGLVWLIFAIAFGADTFAYFTGKAFSKFGKTHPLAPVISPNKTIEGAIGGLVGATLLTYGLSFYLVDIEPWMIGAAPFLAAGSILGDLVASQIKRTVKIKDYGHLMPGHGGVMDRFDSILVVTVLLATFYMIQSF